MMTVKEARAELRSYRSMLDMCARKKQHINELTAESNRCKISKYGTGTKGRNPYHMEEIIDKLDKATANFAEALLDKTYTLQKIEGKIDKLTGRHYTVLHKKYIQGKSYELIAVEEHYSYERVRHIENEAIIEYIK